MKNKAVSMLCMSLILAILYGTCYLWFYRTIDLDVTRSIVLVYDGESGSASVDVKPQYNTVNQRIVQFYESAQYLVEPKENLSNGDVITITVQYDKELAQRYHIQPLNTIREIVVADLPETISSIYEIPFDYLNGLNQKAEAYFEKNLSAILKQDFSDVQPEIELTLKSKELKHRVFLNSVSSQKDRILDIYALDAQGSTEDGSAESTIYYCITYTGINDAFQLEDVRVYGEKLYNSAKLDLSKQKACEKLLKQRYDGYEIIFFK